MAVTAGALSKTLVGSVTATLTSAAATGGTGPYTYQWYRSTTSGFTPGAGNLIAGATALVLNDSGLQPGVTYYYAVIATDTGAGNTTSTSALLTVLLTPGQNQNQFAQNSMVGVVDLSVGPTNVISCEIDPSVTVALQPGQAVKIVSNTAYKGVPKVQPISAKGDACFGFVVFNIKDIQYTGNRMVEVALFGTVIQLFATGAIAQFGQACIDPTYIGGVQASGNTATMVGWALDGCAAAGMIRVMLLPNPSFATA